ncbi:hypothetical protein N0V84_000216 [Fusarium piperis]|uniref:CN hydrolase domain-containing protein n=1 Tax=Fusarium piperis TaxID=1435070 RepID=A0A9W8WNL4_9HYPO|nr:hypothetical protein N0V84_000216 [Fusarium piperis]
MRVDSDEMRRIRKAARDNHIFVSLGFSEIDYATCYLAQVMIDPNGEVINHRRKIKPSHVEKLVYGDGSAEQWADLITTAYAIETKAWTIAPFHRISHEGIKKNTPPGVEPEAHPEHYNGWGRIFAPDGTCVAKADKGFDGLLITDASPKFFRHIDLNETHIPKAVHDYGGHYGRPDLIRLLVDTRGKELVTEDDPEGNIITYSTRERLCLHLPLDPPNSRNEKANLVGASRPRPLATRAQAQRRKGKE